MPSLEDQFTTLKNYFGALVSTVKDLKISVENLKKKSETSQITEIIEVLETQKVIEEVIVSNSDAIKKIKQDIAQIADSKSGDKPADVGDTPVEKGVNEEDDFMKEIIKKQQVVDKTKSANSDKMKRIDKEIKDLLTDKNKKNESRKEIENTLKKLVG